MTTAQDHRVEIQASPQDKQAALLRESPLRRRLTKSHPGPCCLTSIHRWPWSLPSRLCVCGFVLRPHCVFLPVTRPGVSFARGLGGCGAGGGTGGGLQRPPGGPEGDVVEAARAASARASAVGCVGAGARAGWRGWCSCQQHQLRARPNPGRGPPPRPPTAPSGRPTPFAP